MGHLGQSTPISTVQDKEIVLTGSDGHTFKMKIADLAEAVRQVMPIATQEQNGLMNKNGLIIRSDMGQNNLENVGTTCGYTYADGDGSGIPGPFFSIKGGVSCIQLKANYQGSMLRFRVYNQVDEVWSKWKSISFTL